MAEVKDGYKMTELGEIPSDWQLKFIKDVADVISGGTPSKSIENYWYNGDIPWATPTDITKNKSKYIEKTDANITQLGLDKSSATLLPPGAVLMTSRASIGECSIAKIPMTTNQGFKSFICKECLNNEFMYYVLKILKPYFLNNAYGSTFLELSKSTVENQLIIVPSVKEQQKIAEILSTVDEQIEHTEKIIKKTKELKKGLMQQLLTKGIGHTHFKQSELGEIPVNWEVKLMGELYRDLKTGATPYRGKKEYYVGDIPWLSSGELKKKYISKTNEYISTEAVKDTNLTIYEPGTFFIAITGLEAAGTRGSCGIITIPTTTNQSCLAFQINNRVNNEYLYYWYLYWGEWIAFNYAQGTKQQSLNLKIVESLKILLPPIEEQQKIASILSTIDEQIESYEKEKVKYKELKKGLMQQLLTGRVRVKIDE